MPNYSSLINQFLDFCVQLTGRQPAVQTIYMAHENSLQGGQPLKRMIFKTGKFDGDFETNDDETVFESGCVYSGYIKANKVIIQAGGRFVGTMLLDELENYGYCKAENSLVKKLKVFSGAKLDGDITFATIEVEAGASIKASLYPEGSEFSVDIHSVMIGSVMDRDTTGSSKEAATTTPNELDDIFGMTADLDDELPEQ